MAGYLDLARKAVVGLHGAGPVGRRGALTDLKAVGPYEGRPLWVTASDDDKAKQLALSYAGRYRGSSPDKWPVYRMDISDTGVVVPVPWSSSNQELMVKTGLNALKKQKADHEGLRDDIYQWVRDAIDRVKQKSLFAWESQLPQRVSDGMPPEKIFTDSVLTNDWINMLRNRGADSVYRKEQGVDTLGLLRPDEQIRGCEPTGYNRGGLVQVKGNRRG